MHKNKYLLSVISRPIKDIKAHPYPYPFAVGHRYKCAVKRKTIIDSSQAMSMFAG